MKKDKTELLVIGGGPGGYAAAFYAAERGLKVTLVEQAPRLGGICMNHGCIPSKALLQTTQAMADSLELRQRGVAFDRPRINLGKMRQWKESVIEQLGKGLGGLAKKRRVSVIQGRAYFEDSETVRVETEESQRYLGYERCIVATGSRSVVPSAWDLGNPRIMTSREALQLEEVPDQLLVIGGGYIGMELGAVYARLGSEVTVVEALERILSVADADLVKPVERRAKELFRDIRLETKIKDMATRGSQIEVVEEADGKETTNLYDRVLVSVGRRPNTENLGLENTKVERNDKGEIEVNGGQETADERLLAIGDVTGGMYLAHEASREGRIAVDTCLGEADSRLGRIIPAVVFTDPEIAWCGLTEKEAEEKEIEVETSVFPWSASGRALTHDRPDGLTKLVIDPRSERVLGVGVSGHGASELIAEGVLAVEMAATARDLAEVTHPHPTLSETLMEAAEKFYGSSTHSL